MSNKTAGQTFTEADRRREQEATDKAKAAEAAAPTDPDLALPDDGLAEEDIRRVMAENTIVKAVADKWKTTATEKVAIIAKLKARIAELEGKPQPAGKPPLTFPEGARGGPTPVPAAAAEGSNA